jgi:hypothetical protein
MCCDLRRIYMPSRELQLQQESAASHAPAAVTLVQSESAAGVRGRTESHMTSLSTVDRVTEPLGTDIERTPLVVPARPSMAPSPTRPVTSATAPCAWPFTPSNPATIALTVLADIASAPFVFSPIRKQAAPLLRILISCVQCLICCRVDVFRLHFLSVHIRCESVVAKSLIDLCQLASLWNEANQCH